MLTRLAVALVLAIAAVNLAPVSGVLSAGRLADLYDIRVDDESLLVLLRHRAVLFGIVGGLLVAAAFHRPLRIAAYAAGLTSMLSFVAIAGVTPGTNDALSRIVAVDVVASALLVGAIVLDRIASRGPDPS